ncbi:unnamed protein product [Nezara viridula]|uniref:Uncharacterized protein n=1 Tax=Nezara viridula TaxID=85310 RepID=A0A9P0HCX6_NEZVI|nr:unnamed protein product [Nezara viridula]
MSGSTLQASKKETRRAEMKIITPFSPARSWERQVIHKYLQDDETPRRIFRVVSYDGVSCDLMRRPPRKQEICGRRLIWPRSRHTNKRKKVEAGRRNRRR